MRFALDLRGQPFGGDEDVAAAHQLPDFVPVDFAGVETQGHPTSRPDICRKAKTVRLGGHEGLVVARQRFAGEGDDAVAMMIVEKVREYFLADEKGDVPAVKLVRSFRQGLRDLDQARQARVLGAPFAACGWVWPLHRL